MGFSKQAWCDAREAEEVAIDEETQSRLHLSCLCRASVRQLAYPFDLHIIEIARNLA